MAMTCFVCDGDGLLAKDALVVALDILTNGREIPLKNIVLEECVCHQKCAARASSIYKKLVFYRFLTTKDLLARLLERERVAQEREKIIQAADAKREAERAAEAEKLQLQAEAAAKGAAVCVSTRPLLPMLPTMKIKIVDENGDLLQGVVDEHQVRLALESLHPDLNRKKERDRARRKAAKAERDLKDAHNREMTRVIMRWAS